MLNVQQVRTSLRKGNITKAAEASVKRRNMRIESWPAGRGVRFGEASDRAWGVITEEFVGSQMANQREAKFIVHVWVVGLVEMTLGIELV